LQYSYNTYPSDRYASQKLIAKNFKQEIFSKTDGIKEQDVQGPN